MTESNDHQIKHPVTEGVSGSKSNVGQINQTDKEPITAEQAGNNFAAFVINHVHKHLTDDGRIFGVLQLQNTLTEAITQHTTTLQAQLEKYKAAFALMSVNRFDADKENDALRAKLQEIRQSKGCLLAGPGRGDCEHFVGWPEKLDESTTDVYGIPNGWCIVCFHGKQLSDKDKEIERIHKTADETEKMLIGRVAHYQSELERVQRGTIPELQTKLEQSEARLALVVEFLQEVAKHDPLSAWFDGEDPIGHHCGLLNVKATKLLDATQEQVSSYRESLIQAERERLSVDLEGAANNALPEPHRSEALYMADYIRSGLSYDEWCEQKCESEALQNQGGV